MSLRLALAMALLLATVAAVAPPAQASGSVFASVTCSNVDSDGKAHGVFPWASAGMYGSTYDAGETKGGLLHYRWAKGTGGGWADAGASTGVRWYNASCSYGSHSTGDELPKVGCLSASESHPGTASFDGAVGQDAAGAWWWLGTVTQAGSSQVMRLAAESGQIVFGAGQLLAGRPDAFVGHFAAGASFESAQDKASCAAHAN